MKGPLIYSVAVTILAVGAIGFLGGFLVYGTFDDQPEAAKESDAPGQTRYDPRLTSRVASPDCCKSWRVAPAVSMPSYAVRATFV